MKVTHTKGGHKITGFRKLDEPLIMHANYGAIYAGVIKNDYTKQFQECHWDENGEVINRDVPKYDIDLTNPPKTN